jgi:hypothetical protein
LTLLHISRKDDGEGNQSNESSSSDEYSKLIRRRIGLALLESTDKKRDKNFQGSNKSSTLAEPRPLLVPTNCPLINDDTTNSDDSDTYSVSFGFIN